MEYRMKYRDIPWRVAIGVFPGKVVGSLVIRPYVFLHSKRWFRNLPDVLKMFGLIAAIGIVVFVVIAVIIDAFSGGDTIYRIASRMGIVEEVVHKTLPIIGPGSH